MQVGLPGGVRARLNSGEELGLLHHLTLEVVVELIGVVLDVDILWERRPRRELVGVFELLQAVPGGGWLLPRLVVCFLFNSILFKIDRIYCFGSWVFYPQLLRGLADGHVLHVDLDDKVAAHLVVAQVVILDHVFLY